MDPRCKECGLTYPAELERCPVCAGVRRALPPVPAATAGAPPRASSSGGRRLAWLVVAGVVLFCLWRIVLGLAEIDATGRSSDFLDGVFGR